MLNYLMPVTNNTFKTSCAVTIREGIWYASFMAYGLAVLEENTISINITEMPDLAPMPSGIIDKAIEQITERLRDNAKYVLSGQCDLSTYFILTGHTGSADGWRLTSKYGHVNALDEVGYEGTLVATNGMLGITRTQQLDFKLHQMSHWRERLNGRIGRATPAKPSKKTKAELNLDQLLDGLDEI